MNKIYTILILVVIFGFAGFSLTNNCSVCACVICEDESVNESISESPSVIFESIPPSDFANLLDEDFVLNDIRTPQEFNSVHIKGAQDLDFYAGTFESELDALDKNENYLIYCRSGSRTSKTLDMMEDLGFREVYDLQGGINTWKSSGFGVIFS